MVTYCYDNGIYLWNIFSNTVTESNNFQSHQFHEFVHVTFLFHIHFYIPFLYIHIFQSKFYSSLNKNIRKTKSFIHPYVPHTHIRQILFYKLQPIRLVHMHRFLFTTHNSVMIYIGALICLYSCPLGKTGYKAVWRYNYESRVQI